MEEVRYVTELSLKLVKETPTPVYELYEDFDVIIYCQDTENILVTIPKGFRTDFASVPRLPFAYMLFGGIGQQAAVLHDGLYSRWDQVRVRYVPSSRPIQLSRDLCDELFYLGLRASGIGYLKAVCMHRAVRLFGGTFFKKDKADYVVSD